MSFPNTSSFVPGPDTRWKCGACGDVCTWLADRCMCGKTERVNTSMGPVLHYKGGKIPSIIDASPTGTATESDFMGEKHT